MTTYILETRDPTFTGVSQEAEIEQSWSRGMLKKVYLSPMGITVILIHPWLATDQRSFESAWRYKERFKAQTVIVGELKERERGKENV